MRALTQFEDQVEFNSYSSTIDQLMINIFIIFLYLQQLGHLYHHMLSVRDTSKLISR
jgi:hypothetical protein